MLLLQPQLLGSGFRTHPIRPDAHPHLHDAVLHPVTYALPGYLFVSVLPLHHIPTLVSLNKEI